MTHSLSTEKILHAAASMVGRMHTQFPAKHADIGAGEGHLIRLLRQRHAIVSMACDYTKTLMQEPNVQVDVVNLNEQRLPYEDQSLDIVTATEVVEHLENYRQVLRDAYRVLRDGGTIVVTTPNILNLKSRIRFLGFGFYNLFGPLHCRNSSLHTTGNHITPISLFYLIHALLDAGFENVDVRIDKWQRTSLFWLLWCYVPIRVFAYFSALRERKRYQTIDSNNEQYIAMMHSLDILLGRTIVVGAKKPASGATGQ